MGGTLDGRAVPARDTAAYLVQQLRALISKDAHHLEQQLGVPAHAGEDGVPVKDVGARFSRPLLGVPVVEMERETDGRWVAEIVALPGVLAYGANREEALAKAEVLALRVLADRLEHGEAIPEVTGLFDAA